MKELLNLYNGILNDSSIQRYTLGWKSVIKSIKAKYKSIKKTDQQFEKHLIADALAILDATDNKIRLQIEAFARELNINEAAIGECFIGPHGRVFRQIN